MQAMKLWTVACVLLAGSAIGHDAVTRELVDDRLLRTAIGERRFEQVLASHVLSTDELPPSGPLEGPYLTLLSQSIQPKNAFKLATWVLCVAPQPEADGTVLIIDSVRPPQKKGERFEVIYRTMKTAGGHTTRQVWPYAVLIVYGLPDEVVCRAVP